MTTLFKKFKQVIVRLLTDDGNPADITKSERKGAEEAVRRTERRYRALIENAPDGVVMLGVGGRIKFASPSALQMFGYSADEIVSLDPAKLIHPNDLPAVLELLNQLMNRTIEGTPTIEYRCATKAGEWRWVESTFSELIDEEGVEAIVINFRDITKRKRVEEKLRKSEQRYRQLTESSHDLIWEVDAEGTIIFMSAAAKDIYGYEPEEMIGWNFAQLIVPEDLEDALRIFQEALETGKNTVHYETRVYNKAGEIVILDAHAVVRRDEQGNIIGTMGTSQDITKRKQAEQALRESEERFRLAVDHFPYTFVIYDAQRRIQFINERGIQISGYSKEEILGRRDEELFPPQITRTYLPLLKKAVTTHTPQSGECTMTLPAGTFTILVNYIPLLDEHGPIRQILGITHDISERKQAELEIAEKTEILEKIFDNAPVMLCFIDQTGQMTLANREFQRVLGWTLAEIQAHPDILAEWYPDPDYRAWVMDFINKGEGVFAEFHTRTRSGKIRTTSFANVLLADGTSVGIGMDITERKRQEQELQFQSTLLNAVGEAVIATNPAGEVTFWNRAAEQMYGWQQAEVIGRNILEINLSEEMIDSAAEIMQQLKQGHRWQGEFWVKRKDGENFPALVTNVPLYDEGNNLSGILGISRDITELKQAQEALQKNEVRYRALFEDSPIALWEEDFSAVKTEIESLRAAGVTDFKSYFESHPEVVRDLTSKIEVIDVNKNTVTLHQGKSKADFLGKLNITAPELQGEFIPQFVAVATGQTKLEQVTESRTHRGKPIDIILRWSVAPDYQETLSRVIVSMTDITERKRAEQTLQEYASRLQALHEIDRAILAAKSPQVIAQAAVDHLARLITCERVSVGLFEDEYARVLAVHSRGKTKMGQGEKVHLEMLNPIIEQLQRGEIVTFADLSAVKESPPVLQTLQVEGLRTYLTCPLLAQNELIGTLSLGLAQVNAFTPDEKEIVMEVATQLAIALQQAKLFEQIQRHAEELEQRVVERTDQLKEQYQMQATQEERQRLARDLHDAVSQTLFSASLLAEAIPRLWQRHPEQASQSLEELHRLNRGALAEMRTLLLELRPAALAEANMNELLNQLANALASRSHLEVRLQVKEESSLPDEPKITFYRIVQEAINNITKHARAKRVEIYFHSRPRQAVLTIKDDGFGFDSQRQTTGRLGLEIMHERAATVGAKLEIKSASSQGTEIKLVWPGDS